MAFLTRKVTRAKWGRQDGLNEGEIAADAVTSDLRTTDNALSFWRCESPSEVELRKTVLALATTANRLDRMDITWIAEALFQGHGLTCTDSDGQTPVASLKGRHVDVTRLDVMRLVQVAQLVDAALQQGQHMRLTKAVEDDVLRSTFLQSALVQAVDERFTPTR